MELLLSRSQEKRMLGGTMFKLGVRVKLTAEEAEVVKHCKFGDLPLLDQNVGNDRTYRVTLERALAGTSIEHASFLSIATCEQEIRERAGQVHTVLQKALAFGGEEVLTFG